MYKVTIRCSDANVETLTAGLGGQARFKLWYFNGCPYVMLKLRGMEEWEKLKASLLRLNVKAEIVKMEKGGVWELIARYFTWSWKKRYWKECPNGSGN